MNKLADWFDDRTGYRKIVHELLYERIPGGARWRYVWGSTLVFLFATQVITGIFLWMAYSPSAETAWESVYFIQHEMLGGWLLRGIHHYSAQAMVVMLALHVLQVVWYGAYRAPREINWLLGILLLLVVLGLSLTGYLLPWDQKGYWATQVATKIAGATPKVGPWIQKVIVGGPSYGHHTLTRFFALHAGLLPALLTVLLVAHIAIFRRHGVTAPRNAVGEDTFWPQQALRDTLACLVILVGVLVLVGRSGGADLSAPADPAMPYDAARPEWYFLFLFQLLKYFPGESEIIGAMIVPGCVLLFLILMPWIARRSVGHAFCVLVVTGLVTGIGYLTYQAVYDDRYGPEAADYQRAVEQAHERAERVDVLAQGIGIGERGAVALLREDPKTQGPLVFSQNCAQCHRWNGHDGTGRTMKEAATCSDLYGFGSPDWRAWLKEFLSNPAGPKFFGTTANNPDVGDRFTKGAMAEWAEENVPKITTHQMDAIVELLVAESGRTDVSAPDPELVDEGKVIFEFGVIDDENDEILVKPCADCHKLGDIPSVGEVPNAPELTGYGSDQWLRSFILDPGSDRFYGAHNEMPPYKGGRITEQQLELLLRWMRGDWYEPGARGESETTSTEVAKDANQETGEATDEKADAESESPSTPAKPSPEASPQEPTNESPPPETAQ